MLTPGQGQVYAAESSITMTRHSLLMALGCVAALGGAVVAAIVAPQASQITIPEPAFDVLSAIRSRNAIKSSVYLATMC